MNEYNYYPQQNESFLIRLAYKLGAKDRKQAEMYLLVGAIVILAIAAFVYFNYATPKEIPVPQP